MSALQRGARQRTHPRRDVEHQMHSAADVALAVQRTKPLEARQLRDANANAPRRELAQRAVPFLLRHDLFLLAQRELSVQARALLALLAPHRGAFALIHFRGSECLREAAAAAHFDALHLARALLLEVDIRHDDADRCARGSLRTAIRAAVPRRVEKRFMRTVPLRVVVLRVVVHIERRRVERVLEDARCPR